MKKLGIVIVCVLVLGVLTLTSDAGDDKQPEMPRKTSGRTILPKLDMPKLIPPAVQYAIFDEDPVPKFKASLEKHRNYCLRRLSEATNPDERNLMRLSHMRTAWDSGFKDVTGYRVDLLFSAPGVVFALSIPNGKKWIVTKYREIKGKPVCWSFPIGAGAEKDINVVFTKHNVLNMVELYNEVINEQSGKK